MRWVLQSRQHIPSIDQYVFGLYVELHILQTSRNRCLNTCNHKEPWVVLGLTSTDKAIVDKSLDKCLGSASSHPIIVKLNAEPLCTQAASWRAAATIDDLERFEDLLLFVAKLAFVLTSDRPQEETHARLNRTGKLAPQFSAAYNSWRLREPLFEEALRADHAILEDASSILAHVGNFRACARALGLGKHPSLRGDFRAHGRHRLPIHAKVVYKDDGFTQYTMDAPGVRMYPRGDLPHSVERVNHSRAGDGVGGKGERERGLRR